jgi:hypothetical protein
MFVHNVYKRKESEILLQNLNPRQRHMLLRNREINYVILVQNDCEIKKVEIIPKYLTYDNLEGAVVLLLPF